MNEDVKSTSVHIHSRADELIAFLEGEIAKRDEELSACSVAAENCELFRAQIAELEADRDSHQRCAIQAMTKLAALNAQEQDKGLVEALESIAMCADGYSGAECSRIARSALKPYRAAQEGK